MSAQVTAQLAGITQKVVREGIKQGGLQSTEIFRFDFVNLILKLFIFFSVAWLINKIFEAIIFGENTLKTIAGLIGINLPNTLPENIVNFFQNGIQGFRYWDFIKIIATLLVIMEWFSWYEAEKAINKTPSAFTHGVFGVIVLGLTFISVPELFQRLKEIKAMNTVINTSKTVAQGTFDPDNESRTFRAGR